MRNVTHQITMGNKTQNNTSQAGDIRGMLCDRYGEDLVRSMMSEVALISKGFNLFSCTKMMQEGRTLGGDKNSIWLTKDEKKIVFDILINTKKGVVFAAFIRREIGASGIAESSTSILLNKSYTDAHDALAHIGEADTRKIVTYLKNWNVTGVAGKCKSCEVAKAKQKALQQVAVSEPLKEGERRVHLDLCLVKARPLEQGKPAPLLPQPNWSLVVDEATLYKNTQFFATKKEIEEANCVLFKKWESQGTKVTHVPMDGTGENWMLQKRAESADWKLRILFEYTAQSTPQQNSQVEVGFATLTN